MPLDPSIVALTKGIGQQENGGRANPYDFSKVGPDGERGAYQMTPKFIADNAPVYLKGENYDPTNLTPTQQDELAYKVVEARGKAGLTPAQIASEWNSGNKDAYTQNHVGTSPGGAHYDTPAYVNNVAKYYKQNLQKAQSDTGVNSEGIPTSDMQKSGLNQGIAANLSKVPGQLYNAITSLPGHQLGTAVGNSIYDLGAASSALLHGKGLAAADQELKATPGEPTMSQVVGDTAQAVLTPATLAVGGGTGATAIGRIANTGLKYGLLGGGNETGNALSQGNNLTQSVEKGAIAAPISGLFGSGGQAIAEGISPITNSVLKMVTPKLTIGEKQAAMAEGRLIKPPQTIFGGKSADVVNPAPDTLQQSKTIERVVPNATRMNEPQLAQAIKNQVGTMADELHPQLKTVPVTRTDTGKAFDEWNTLKQQQATSHEFVDQSSGGQMGNTRFQNEFQNYLNDLQWDIQDPVTGRMKSPTPKTLDDVWKTAIDYDNSVDSSIKNAVPDKSSDAKLYKQKMWLQNRAILRNMIKSMSAHLPTPAQQAFSDMSDLYEARKTLIRNVQVDTKGTPSLLKAGLLKGGQVLGGVAGEAAGIYAGLKQFLPSQTLSQ